MTSFRDTYGNLSINELFEKFEHVSLNETELGLLDIPPEKFLQFIQNYPATPFDSIPPSDSFIEQPSYMHTQAHRLWHTSKLVNDCLIKAKANSFLDLGSFPFVIPLILRDYFNFKGKIKATSNTPINEVNLKFLEAKGIEIDMLELDPYVKDKNSSEPSFPEVIAEPEMTYDVILSSHVIEHIYHPMQMLNEASRLLNKNGFLVVTTDNAMMIETFENYVANYGYTFEPVKSTAAMFFNFWRGHVRFYTENDMKTMIESVGLNVEGTIFKQCFYDSFFPKYFKQSVPKIAEWKKEMILQTPFLRNDLMVVASKV